MLDIPCRPYHATPTVSCQPCRVTKPCQPCQGEMACWGAAVFAVSECRPCQSRVCRPSPPLECNTQWVRHQDMTGFWVWHQDIIGCVRQAMSSRVCRVTSVAVLGVAVLAVSCQPCQPLRPCWPCHVDYSSRVSYFRFGRVANEHQTFVSCLNSATVSGPCRVTPRHYCNRIGGM